MMHLEVGGRRVPVAAGEMVIGSDFGATLSLTGEGVAPQHAIVQGWTDGSAAVRPLGSAEVLVNGVRLGGDPTPLLHGDKIQVGRHEILAVDVGRVGNTQLMGAIPAPEPGAAMSDRPAGAAVPMSDGRVVCLTDGREYQVGSGPLVFGREAGSDVVVAGGDVSRRHAEIRLDENGAYVIADLSVNGTTVNGARIDGERTLARADVIRIGTDEFRFYGNAAAAPSAAAPASAPEAAAAPESADPAGERQPWQSADPPMPPPGAAQRLFDTMNGLAATPPARPAMPAVAPAIASILIRSGPMKGERLAVRTPVANIGRADYNDLVVADSSVSTMHAKLVRREGLWMIADLGSTNGSWVDEERVEDELPLTPGATIRLGEITMMFEPLDDAGVVEAAGTRTTDRFDLPAAEPVADAPAPSRRSVANAPGRRQTSASSGPSRLPVLLLAGLVIAAVAAGIAFMLLN